MFPVGQHHPRWKDTVVFCTKTRDLERQLYSNEWNVAGTEDFRVEELNSQLDEWSAGRYDWTEEMRTDDEEI